MEKKVSIILVNYNTANDVIECLKSLSSIDYKNFDVIIVDNNSKKEEVKRLENIVVKYSWAELVKSGKNGGFAFANNIGINIAKKRNSDYILLLNSDTEVKPDFLGYLVDAIERDFSKNAISVGKINYYFDKNKIWYAGGVIDWNKYIGKHIGENEIDNGQFNITKKVDFATGCVMLINAKLNININLPEEYFMYYEDVDFSARIIELGYNIIYEPKSVIYHKVGASGGGEGSPFTLKWSNRGRYIFMNKYKHNVSKIRFQFIKLKFYITRFIKVLDMLVKMEPNKAKAIIIGTIEGIKFKGSV
ncbi:glycosyltransferase family 2 protein [Clostridium perfringens]|uniref:glycosyltransferase family 2 protein n=1 Tax=Clostridium perfringens TaxID=1502 RepID=UPI002245E25A|nr:glycosyltransferase family 2 protein [Clostridium perfringens]MCX0371808.1 glycosyltransferase family 2 protein [Clostridium perfringens]MDN4737047.1 glycosyltransferase family 2 protein [Clostridium perfringens]MDN4740552.1 glycosyltransferase family 2 protein [Clostridium perfringens]MDU2663751.1 glycosyltransferase family 2 protein [Clostridium perfringens]MDU6175188.1 glycosyltransferase family 2 protein [Clostridium perfringens]